MNNLFIPHQFEVNIKETLIRELKNEYIEITDNNFKLDHNFTLIDKLNNVSFFRPYILGLEYISKKNFTTNFSNSRDIVELIESNAKFVYERVIKLGRLNLINQLKKRRKNHIFLAEFQYSVFIKNGFLPIGPPGPDAGAPGTPIIDGPEDNPGILTPAVDNIPPNALRYG
jgi:hypothetical protein